MRRLIDRPPETHGRIIVSWLSAPASCAFTVVARSIVWQPLSFKGEYLTAIVAVIGAPSAHTCFFWQAGQEVQDTKAGADARPLTRAPEQALREFTRIRIDTYIGMAISNVVAFFIYRPRTKSAEPALQAVP